MTEKTVLLDATQAVIEAHTDLIANGTVAVASAADFGKFPPGVVGRLIEGWISLLRNSSPLPCPVRTLTSNLSTGPI